MKLIDVIRKCKLLDNLDSSHYTSHSAYRSAYRKIEKARKTVFRFILINRISMDTELICNKYGLNITKTNIEVLGTRRAADTVWTLVDYVLTEEWIRGNIRQYVDSENDINKPIGTRKGGICKA